MGAAGGEAVAAMGGLMVAFGVGTGGAGPALIALGMLASTGFRNMGEWQQQQELDAEFKVIMDGMGLAPELTERLLQQGPGTIDMIAQEYGLPADQLPALLQEPGMVDLLLQPLPPGGLANDTLNPYMQLLNQQFRRPDGTFDGQAYLGFVRAQRDAAADIPYGGSFAFTGALMDERIRAQGIPWPSTPDQWAASLDQYGAWLGTQDAANMMGDDGVRLAQAHLAVTRGLYPA